MSARPTAKLFTALAVAAASILFAATSSSAEDAKAFYKGKTIHFTVGTGAGGGFNTYARMIAPELEKRLGATVVVQNLPGAGGLIAANQIYAAKGDALQMLILNGLNAAEAQLVDDPAARLDVTKYGILGIVVSSPWMWIASPKSEKKTLQDFLKPGQTLTWAGSGQMGGLSDGAAVTCEALKLKCNIIRGYQGSAAASLALTRGEAESMYVSDGSADKYVKSKGAKPIAAVSDERSAFFPNVPTVYEALKLSPDAKWWFDFRASIDGVQRILVMPPGVDKDKLALMQSAIRDILTSKKFIDDAMKKKREIAYQPPAKVEKMLHTVLGALSPAEKKKVKELLLRE